MQLVSVNFIGENKLYDFINKHEFNIKAFDRVHVKVKTGGTKIVIVRQIKEIDKEDIKYCHYKNILEVVNMKYQKKELAEDNVYICDCRIWRNQWNSDKGYYEDTWSDLIVTCLFNGELEIGDLVKIDDFDGKVVNIRQIEIKKTKKMSLAVLKEKEIKKGFLARLFGR